MSTKEEEKEKLLESFRLVQKEVTPKIDEFLKEAEQAIDKAVKLSEENGIPFNTYISFINNTYCPKLKTTKHNWIEIESEIADQFYCEYGYYQGWEHSAIC